MRLDAFLLYALLASPALGQCVDYYSDWAGFLGDIVVTASDQNPDGTPACWGERFTPGTYVTIEAVAPYFDCNNGIYLVLDVFFDMEGPGEPPRRQWVMVLDPPALCRGYIIGVRILPTELLFADGFEDGTTNAWTTGEFSP